MAFSEQFVLSEEYINGLRVRVTVQDTDTDTLSFVFDGGEFEIKRVVITDRWVKVETVDRGTYRYATDSVRELWTHDAIKVEEIENNEN